MRELSIARSRLLGRGRLCALAVSTNAGFSQSLPSGWATRDIGAVGATGSGSGSSSGAFTLKGAGDDIWETSDAFRFTYTELTGDGSIVKPLVVTYRVR